MSTKKPDRRPHVVHHEAESDGSKSQRVQTWAEAFGNMPESIQAMLEYTHLHNSTISGESDRAAAVLAPAYIDELLFDLLRAALRPGKSAERLLGGSNSPLGTFSARIDTAHALGLIPDDCWRDLHTIRKIRNDFAHDVGTNSFATQAVADRCKNLGMYNRWDGVRMDSPRRAYEFATWAVVNDLVSAMRRCESTEAESAISQGAQVEVE